MNMCKNEREMLSEEKCVLCSEGLFTALVSTFGGSSEAFQLWAVSNRGFIAWSADS